MQIIEQIQQIFISILNTYIKYCFQFQTAITTISFILSCIIISFLISEIMTEKHEKYIKDEIPEIIELSMNIQNIQNYIDNTIEYFSDDLPPIGQSIKKDTKLTVSQLNFIRYIKNLEMYQEKWDNYSFQQLINASIIKSPYRIAYEIRSLLEIPFIKDVETNDIDVWLTKEESDCVINYELKLINPILQNKEISPPSTPELLQNDNKNDDHIIICVKCKELITEKEAEKLVLKKYTKDFLDIQNKDKTFNAINEISDVLNSGINSIIGGLQSTQLSKNA